MNISLIRCTHSSSPCLSKDAGEHRYGASQAKREFPRNRFRRHSSASGPTLANSVNQAYTDTIVDFEFPSPEMVKTSFIPYLFCNRDL